MLQEKQWYMCIEDKTLLYMYSSLKLTALNGIILDEYLIFSACCLMPIKVCPRTDPDNQTSKF